MSSSESAIPRATPHIAVASRTSIRVWPEPLALTLLAGILNFWDLSRNGWANTYYAGAVRSMSSSWHNFLFASFDPSGAMTVDKPPLALWVQALSARVFGFHSLSILAPQALMGVASVLLVYDLTRRRFGRPAGFVAGLVLALTPIAVAISRHNNPDALLILLSVAALWCALRALEDGRTRWLVLAGVCVGLAFETKMLVAMMVVPGIAAAWIWIAPSGRPRIGALRTDAPRAHLRALRQLLAGGLALLLVGGAWPALVELTPAADRPWVSGTADNTILSLIFGYNGLGRIEGQGGGPQALGGSNLFGGSTGPLRLLNEALGGQAGWLLGFALVSGLAILAACRLRRADPRSGWLLVVGGAFLTTAVVFSFAQGIFHPYYVSLLAPFCAALVGAGFAQLQRGGRAMRALAALALAAGVATELAVLHHNPAELRWLTPTLIVLGALAAALLLVGSPRLRLLALTGALALLLIAPATWAFETLGHATSGTFPAGGPADNPASGLGGGPGGRPGSGSGGFGSGTGAPGFAGPPGAGNAGQLGAGSAARPGAGSAGAAGGPPPGAAQGAPAGGPPALFGNGSTAAPPTSGGTGAAAGPGAAGATLPSGGSSAGSGAGRQLGGAAGGRTRGTAGNGPFGGTSQSLTAAVRYAKSHGGGTLAVSGQSEAAALVIAGDHVAGIGGFSGRESEVGAAWLAAEVRSGQIRWVLTGSSGPGGANAGPGGGFAGVGSSPAASGRSGGLGSSSSGSSGSAAPGRQAGSAAALSSTAGSGAPAGAPGGRDQRVGSSRALSAVAKTCQRVSSVSGLYDCTGDAAALAAAGAG